MSSLSLNFGDHLIQGKDANAVRETNGKCFMFSVNDKAENLISSEVEVFPGASVKKKCLYGAAMSLSGRSMIYHCTKFRCQIPCPCTLCHKKKYPTCQSPVKCHCEECTAYFQDHDTFHAMYHVNCKFCDVSYEMFMVTVKEGNPSDKFAVKEWNFKNIRKNNNSTVSFESKPFSHDYSNPYYYYDLSKKEDVRCYQCNRYFKSGPCLIEHVDSVHYKEDHQCNFCTKSFSRKDNLERHVVRFHENQDCGEALSCDICDKKFTRRDTLLRHQKIHNASNDSILGCKVCGKQFNRETNLSRHMKVHLSDESRNRYTCGFCETKFSLNAHLERHLLCVHNENGEFKNKCTACEENFCTGKQLKCHVMTKHFSLSCVKCDRIFSNRSNLNAHIRKTILHKCNKCNMQLCNRNTLVEHMEKMHPTFDVHIENKD